MLFCPLGTVTRSFVFTGVIVFLRNLGEYLRRGETVWFKIFSLAEGASLYKVVKGDIEEEA